MRALFFLLFIIIVITSMACDESGSSEDGGTPVDSAWLEDCRAEAALDIGRCVDGAGTPCTGGEATADAFFDPLPADGTLAPVIGPQGAAMFALAVRASGIAPGDPAEAFSSDNPILEIDLLDETASELVATYRGRSGMRVTADMADTFEHPQVFVVVDHSISTLRGDRLQVEAVLTDTDGALRCGSAELFAPES